MIYDNFMYKLRFLLDNYVIIIYYELIEFCVFDEKKSFVKMRI
jgi:hypothetical protein